MSFGSYGFVKGVHYLLQARKNIICGCCSGGRYPIQAGNQRGLTRQRRDFARGTAHNIFCGVSFASGIGWIIAYIISGRGTYVGQGAEQTMQQQQQGRVLRKAIVYRPGEQQSDKPVMNLFDPTKVPRSRNYFEVLHFASSGIVRQMYRSFLSHLQLHMIALSMTIERGSR